MKTHMNNTQSQNIKNDILAHKIFQKHQEALHTSSIKPKVVTKRVTQVKIVKNNKVQLNTDPTQHVKHLFNVLHNDKKKGQSNIKSTLDNKCPQHYQLRQTLLKDKIKKNKQQKHKQTQHQRQWKTLQDRILNCKSLQQRKKDKTDPIVNPVYMLDKGENVKDLTIYPYCAKILNMNRPKSAVYAGTRNLNVMGLSHHTNTIHAGEPITATYGSGVPAKQRPSTAKQAKEVSKENNINNRQNDLPQPTFKSIMSYLLTNKIYKDSDIKVLYVRLCYIYGENHIEDIWEQVMDELEK